MRACVCSCVRAYVRACVRACVRVFGHACRARCHNRFDLNKRGHAVTIDSILTSARAGAYSGSNTSFRGCRCRLPILSHSLPSSWQSFVFPDPFFKVCGILCIVSASQIYMNFILIIFIINKSLDNLVCPCTLHQLASKLAS